MKLQRPTSEDVALKCGGASSEKHDLYASIERKKDDWKSANNTTMSASLAPECNEVKE